MHSLLIIENDDSLKKYFKLFSEEKIIQLRSVNYNCNIIEDTDFLKNITHICLKVDGNLEKVKKFLESFKKISWDKSFFLSFSGQKLSEPELDEIFNIAKDYKNIKFLFDLDLDQRLYFPYLRDVFCTSGRDQGDYQLISNYLINSVSKVENEYEKVQTLHNFLVPKRSQKFKGIEVSSKFIAGESSGGEFFDIIERNKKIFLLSSFSTSYSTSSIIHTLFEKIKEEDNEEMDLSYLEDGISFLDEEMNRKPLKIVKKNIPPLQLFMGVINLRTLSVEGYSFGHYMIISSDKGLIREDQQIRPNEFSLRKDEAFFNFRMGREEKIVLLSPGLQYNVKDSFGSSWVKNFVIEQLRKGHDELLNKIFYQVSKSKKEEDQFYSYDASALMFEVNKNVIFQA